MKELVITEPMIGRRPPLGICPVNIDDYEGRRQRLIDTVERYINEGFAPLELWLYEIYAYKLVPDSDLYWFATDGYNCQFWFHNKMVVTVLDTDKESVCKKALDYILTLP